MILYSLPETEFGRGLPEFIGFFAVSFLEELVVNNEERVRRKTFWKRRERQARHYESDGSSKGPFRIDSH